jgi:hypothetical protein
VTDLEAIRLASAPREDALVRRLAARIDSVGGFIAYGILWLFAALIISQAALIGTLWFVQQILHSPPWSATAVLVGWLLGFALAWWPFVAWVRRRRAAARRLFREGVMLEGTLLSVDFLTLKGAPFTRARFGFQHGGDRREATLSVAEHDHGLVAGGSIPVLFVGGYRYCAAFPSNGTTVPAAY